MMSATAPVRIPAGKLGTVRIDRTVDAYAIPIATDESALAIKSFISKILLYCPSETAALTAPLTVQSCQEIEEEDDDEETSDDIAVIYSLVRHGSTRRASVPRISVLPLPTTTDISSPQLVKTYTLEPPLTPIVTHRSKQAQIKSIPSARANVNSAPPTFKSTEASSSLTPPNRIQASNSLTSHDRPLLSTKPRPYSFRSARRNALERQILNITERVSQLHDSFFSRLTHTHPPPRNRSLSTFHAPVTDPNLDASNAADTPFIRPRPKSDTFDDHFHVQTGNDLRAAQESPSSSVELRPTFQCHRFLSIIVSTLIDVQKTTSLFLYIRASSILVIMRAFYASFDGGHMTVLILSV